jgi:hypothetical protein
MVRVCTAGKLRKDGVAFVTELLVNADPSVRNDVPEKQVNNRELFVASLGLTVQNDL